MGIGFLHSHLYGRHYCQGILPKMQPYKFSLPKPINIKHYILASVDVSRRRLQDIQAAILLLSFSDLRPYWIVFDILAEYIRGFIQCSLNFKISCY